MLCFRVIQVILLAIVTACATCAILFPQFRYVATAGSKGDITYTVYFWYNETKVDVSGTAATMTLIQYSRDMTCTEQYLSYNAQAALSVAGAGLGGISTLFMSCWTSASRSRCLGALTLVTTFLALVCCAATTALSAVSFTRDMCGTKSPQKTNYDLVEGFGLICAATGGYLILLFLEFIECCCCCCSGPSHDEDDKDDE